MSESTRLNGRTILVTGAAGDIGSAVARFCVTQGADVLLTDLPSKGLDQLAEELDARSVAADLGDASEARCAVRELVEHAAPDGLVTAAGMNTRTSLIDMSLEEWDKVQHVNLRGTFVVVQEVARAMLEAGSDGSIVTVGSIGAWQPYPGLGHYEAAKAAVLALTRAWAMSLAPHQIRVNAVAPGVIDTSMTRTTLADAQTRSERLARIPLDRFGTPHDVAHGVCYLLSNAAAWMTGTTLTIDGGQSVGSMLRDPDPEARVTSQRPAGAASSPSG